MPMAPDPVSIADKWDALDQAIAGWNDGLELGRKKREAQNASSDV